MEVIVDGDAILIATAKISVIDSQTFQITYGATILKLTVLGPDSLPRTLPVNKPLYGQRNDMLFVEGEGYAPGTNVTIWIFSTPIKLGSTPVDKQGKITGKFLIPAAVEIGAHTIQVNGIDSQKRALSVSVQALIEEKAIDPVDEEIKNELGNETGPGFTSPAFGKTITKGVLFKKNSSTIVTYEKKVISTYKKVLAKTSQVTCIGFTYSKKPSKNEIAIAKSQATASCKYLLPAKKAKFKIAIKDIKLAKKTGRRTSATKKYPVNIVITTPKKA